MGTCEGLAFIGGMVYPKPPPKSKSFPSFFMITTIRKHQRWLLLLVAIMTIIAFAWLYNTTDTDKLGENQVAQLYGRTIYRPEVDRAVRIQHLAMLLGLEDFLRSLSLTAQSEEAVTEEFVWNLMVLRHQADALYLQPTDEQVVEAIRTLPALNRNGEFDRERYLDLLQNQLAPRGLTERHLEDLIRDSLRLQMVRRILDSPMQLGSLEEKELSRSLEKIDAQLIELGALTEATGGAVTDEEVTAFFEENASALQTPEFRKIAYLKIGLDENEAALEGKERIEALQKAANRIAALAEEVVGGKSLEAAASEAGIPIAESVYFDGTGATRGEDPALPGAPVELPSAVVGEAFRIASPQGVGDILQDEGDFYLVEVRDSIAPRPLTFEEIAPRIREMLTLQRSETARQLQAGVMRGLLESELKTGRPLAEIAQEKQLNIREFKGLEPWKQGMDEQTLYARTVAELAPGQLSPVSRNSDGFYVLLVTNRQEPDAQLLASEGARLKEEILKSKQLLLFAEWLRGSREAAGLKYFQRGS